MKINKYKISLYFIIGIGITVRLVQYFFNRGLWMDEASLGLAIIDTSISLFKPLPNLQVAPILFLLVERIAFLLLGSSELALRLFPLVCSLISIPFAYLFFRNLTNDKRTALIALTIFALAPSLIYYSSELKQYSVDVFVGLILFYITTGNFSNKKRNLYLLLSGSIGIFVSNVTPLILFTVGVYYLFIQIKEKRINVSFIFIGLSWSLLFLLYYCYFIYRHSTKTFMLEFWSGSFMPINPLKPDFWNFFLKKVGYFVKLIFVYTKVNKIYVLILISSVLGIGIWKALTKNSPKILYFIFFPILLHLIISALKIYPFQLRLVLYLTPLFILIASLGLNSIYMFFAKFTKNTTALIPIILFFALMGFENRTKFPFNRMESKTILEYVDKNIKADQKIYIHWTFESAYEYYKKAGDISLENIDIIIGATQDDCNKYLREISKLKGDVWFVFVKMQNSKTDCIFKYLNTNGELLDSHSDYRTDAFLYRL